MDVPGVPETIPRAAFLALVRSLGLDPELLHRLEFSVTGVYAEVFALDLDGRRYRDLRPGHEDEAAMHRITIKIVEEDPPCPVPPSPSTTATT